MIIDGYPFLSSFTNTERENMENRKVIEREPDALYCFKLDMQKHWSCIITNIM